jgi:hypothetical protein
LAKNESKTVSFVAWLIWAAKCLWIGYALMSVEKNLYSAIYAKELHEMYHCIALKRFLPYGETAIGHTTKLIIKIQAFSNKIKREAKVFMS